MACSLYNQHHWKFACKLELDYIDKENTNLTIDDKTINKTFLLVRKDYTPTLVFYCPCGQLKKISTNGRTISNVQETTPTYDGKIE